MSGQVIRWLLDHPKTACWLIIGIAAAISVAITAWLRGLT